MTLITGTAGKQTSYQEPAPGCVDQKLSLFTSSTVGGVIRHEELPIPPKSDTPYALEVLLDVFRQQFLNMLDTIKNPDYKDYVLQQIEVEKVCADENCPPCMLVPGFFIIFAIDLLRNGKWRYDK